MTEFMNGLAFNQLFYEEVVRPILRVHFPELGYSAALIGWGSDVLGYDDVQSTDHNWGPRFQLFLADSDYLKLGEAIGRVLDAELPTEFHGYPTGFVLVGDEHQRDEGDSPRHNIVIETIRRFFTAYLGCDPYGEIKAADWLTFAEHRLLGVTSGRVFHDGLRELEPVRQKFRYYPRDVWLYMLAAQWTRISEEQAFVGRCGFVGDELGSMLIAARQVKNLMRLCFLMERRYAPYSKWFGTAFRELASAQELQPIFMKVLQAPVWTERQEFLAQAYETVSRMHNALGITPLLRETPAQYFDRPYLVLGDERFAEDLRRSLISEEVKRIEYSIGSINQFVDSNDQLNNLDLGRRLRALYL